MDYICTIYVMWLGTDGRRNEKQPTVVQLQFDWSQELVSLQEHAVVTHLSLQSRSNHCMVQHCHDSLVRMQQVVLYVHVVGSRDKMGGATRLVSTQSREARLPCSSQSVYEIITCKVPLIGRSSTLCSELWWPVWEVESNEIFRAVWPIFGQLTCAEMPYELWWAVQLLP